MLNPRKKNMKRDSEIQKLVLQGFHLREIANKAGCSTSAVRTSLKRLGISLQSERNKRFTELWNEGCSNQEISEALRCNINTITAKRKKFGLPPKHGCTWITEEMEREIVKLRTTKAFTIPQLMKHFQVGWGSIQRVLERNNVNRLKKKSA